MKKCKKCKKSKAPVVVTIAIITAVVGAAVAVYAYLKKKAEIIGEDLDFDADAFAEDDFYPDDMQIEDSSEIGIDDEVNQPTSNFQPLDDEDVDSDIQDEDDAFDEGFGNQSCDKKENI